MKFAPEIAINTPVSYLWQQFSSTTKQLQEKFVPDGMQSTRNSQPWFNSECKKTCQKEKRSL